MYCLYCLSLLYFLHVNQNMHSNTPNYISNKIYLFFCQFYLSIYFNTENAKNSENKNTEKQITTKTQTTILFLKDFVCTTTENEKTQTICSLGVSVTDFVGVSWPNSAVSTSQDLGGYLTPQKVHVCMGVAPSPYTAPTRRSI